MTASQIAASMDHSTAVHGCLITAGG